MNTTIATQLTTPERELLLSILRQNASELYLEIRHTRTPDYHDALKEKKQLLLQMIEKLEN